MPNKFLKFRLAKFGFNLLIHGALLEIRCQENGNIARLGQKNATQCFVMSIDTEETLWRLITNPDPGLGEFYMAGKWRLEQGDLGEFMVMLASGRDKLFNGPFGKVIDLLISKHPDPDEYDHSIQNSYTQVQHHYDIGNELYRLFLDEGMNYSCAFFENPNQSLRDAQLNKINTAIERLDIQQGMSVLDIGCGWGETTRTIAAQTGANAAGVTLAETQLAIAQERAKTMDNPPQYYLQDYREHALENQASYDRIISIGMFEHVGHQNYHEYFGAINRQLKPDGRALIHSIVKPINPSSARLSSPWLEKYIFPGGCLCQTDEMVTEAEKQGLELAHEPFIHDPFHYAHTLRHWRKNFLANIDKLDSQKYDQTFINMWTYYLAMCEGMFEGCKYHIAQVLFKKKDA